MSEITHPAPAQSLSLEERRDRLSLQDATLTTQRKVFARDLHKLKKDWGLLYPKGTARQFILWFCQGEYQARLYSYLDAGAAAAHGLDDEHLHFGELAERGKRLLAGESPEEIRAAPAARSETTTIRLNRETADALALVTSEMSEADNLTRQEQVEVAVTAFVAAGETVQRAMVRAANTGENPLDALVRAIDDRRDYRAVLKRQPCSSCGYSGPDIELHHLRLEANERYRTHDYLTPLCGRCHTARPGDSTDSIHARPLADLLNDAAFWRNSFRAVSTAAEATRQAEKDGD
ncbi:hypothetical protein [Deinococcus wulumuqiensis]|uniref:HNH endonuclease n=1 Tax=Deinococcus wulumuqiensis TaxID=980427 RepID=A0AAV4K5E4_9DEIO|nr:hypothetical protein [Deinococcus wulumuqiensis]QII20015.1 hypothetical protein G6R31_04015 [Deinococcus wulumuqiensis R12]GGI86993.1 hypothetical protein GCM10010914_21770 [Deinococcus wulumuqiensis]GGP29950.1 hypothetical protein GCM10008021_16010 [Deinococcus wulumuqiensis]